MIKQTAFVVMMLIVASVSFAHEDTPNPGQPFDQILQEFDGVNENLNASREIILDSVNSSANGAKHWISPYWFQERFSQDVGKFWRTAKTNIHVLNTSFVLPTTVMFNVYDVDGVLNARHSRTLVVPARSMRTHLMFGGISAFFQDHGWLEVISDQNILIDGQIEYTNVDSNTHVGALGARNMTWYRFGAEQEK